MSRSEPPRLKTSSERWFPYTFLFTITSALLLGLFVVRDYGVTYDEAGQRNYGRMVYEYVVQGNQDLFKYPDRFYGPVFEFVLYTAERILGPQDKHSIFLLRHTLTFLFFFLGALCFYGVAKRLFNSRWLGLLGLILLFLSPRIVADAFYNSKDIPLLAAFSIAMWTLLVFREHRTVPRLLMHALACAAAADIRLVGVLSSVISVACFVSDVRHTESDRKRPIVLLVIFMLATTGLLIVLWPTLWHHPIAELSYAVSQTLHYPWSGIVFFRGRYFRAQALPRYYVPLWMLITTPLLYTVLGVWGAFISIRSLRSWAREPQNCRSLLPLVWFFLPVILVIAFRSTLYDGWRHLYFVYPAWLLLILRGMEELRAVIKSFDSRWQSIVRLTCVAVVLTALGDTMFFMVRNHPLQNLFFSSVIGGIRGADGRFELDYWGPSYKQAIEQLLLQESKPVITASFHNFPGELNAETMPPQLRNRIQIVPFDQAEYFFTNFRDQYMQRLPYPETVGVKVDGVTVLSVYRLR